MVCCLFKFILVASEQDCSDLEIRWLKFVYLWVQPVTKTIISVVLESIGMVDNFWGRVLMICRVAIREVLLSIVLAVLRINDPGEEAIALESCVFLVDFLRALQVVSDVVIAEGRTRDLTSFSRTTPVQFTYLEYPMITTVAIISGSVKSGLMESDANPGRQMFLFHAQTL